MFTEKFNFLKLNLMKKLANLKGAKSLSKKEQKSINGGFNIIADCVGKNVGDPCYVIGDPQYRRGNCVTLRPGGPLVCSWS